MFCDQDFEFVLVAAPVLERAQSEQTDFRQGFKNFIKVKYRLRKNPENILFGSGFHSTQLFSCVTNYYDPRTFY